MKAGVQDAEGRVVLAGDSDELMVGAGLAGQPGEEAMFGDRGRDDEAKERGELPHMPWRGSTWRHQNFEHRFARLVLRAHRLHMFGHMSEWSLVKRGIGLAISQPKSRSTCPTGGASRPCRSSRDAARRRSGVRWD